MPINSIDIHISGRQDHRADQITFYVDTGEEDVRILTLHVQEGYLELYANESEYGRHTSSSITRTLDKIIEMMEGKP